MPPNVIIDSTVILDIGSIYIRAGIAGMSSPQCNFKHNISNFANEIVISELLQNIFIEILRIKPKSCNVLIIENLLASRFSRNLLITVLLKDFQVHSVTFQPNLYLGMLGSGCSSAVVLNIGNNETHCICFAMGRPLIQTLRVASVGLAHAIDFFQSTLEMEQISGADSIESLFERVACCSYKTEKGTEVTCLDMYVAPCEGIVSSDSRGLFVSAEERSSCLSSLISGSSKEGAIKPLFPLILLGPDCIDENGGAAGILLESLRACNHDVRYSAAKHIIIMGEGSMIPGITYAICNEATKLVKTNSDVYQSCLESVMNKLSPHQQFLPLPTAFPRNHLAWVGGSLFASLKENKCKYITLLDLLSKNGNNNSEASNVTAAEEDNERIMKVAAATTPVSSQLLIAPDWQSLDETDWRFGSVTHRSS